MQYAHIDGFFFKTDLKFDVILNMEIIEHVKDVDFFLESCSKLLKDSGTEFNTYEPVDY